VEVFIRFTDLIYLYYGYKRKTRRFRLG